MSALTISGSAEKVALADWLLDELDRPANDQGAAQPRDSPAPYSFRERGDESVVRVRYPTHTAADRLNEMAALLVHRHLAGIRISPRRRPGVPLQAGPSGAG